MDFSINSISVLTENCLLKVIADFNSEMKLRSAITSLNNSLRTKVVKKGNSDTLNYNSELFISEDGTFHLKSPFMNYGDFRLFVINLLNWIKENGSTDKRCNFIVDLKLKDQIQGPFKGTMFFKGNTIESIDTLKFVLSFNEAKIFENFPDRIDNFRAQSIKKIEPIQKFSNGMVSQADPNTYKVSNTANSGVNFETLSKGYLRMQYIGGENYENKPNKILAAIQNFTQTAYECVIDKKLNHTDLYVFNKLIDKYKKIQKAYRNYTVFHQEYPKIVFTVNMYDDEKVLSQFYDVLKDRIYELISNLDFKYNSEWFLNYDSLAQVLQIKDATLNVKTVSNVEFIDCRLTNGNFILCDFYLSSIDNSHLQNCNVYRETVVKNSKLIDSFSNRTSKNINCEITGVNSVTNCEVEGGIIVNTKLGKFAEIKDDVKVVKYEKLKTGFIVAADTVISKNPNKIKVG